MPGGAGPARAGILGEAARTGFGVRPPCGQPPARPPLRAVPCIAQRLLALEADVGGQLVRGDRPRAGGVPRAATGQPHPEEEIEWEFLTGLSIDYSSIATEAYGNIPQAIPYVEQALAKLEKYPLEERVHFEKLCREELADIYLYADDPRAAGQIGRCIDLHRAWVAADKRFERPAATRRNT